MKKNLILLLYLFIIISCHPKQATKTEGAATPLKTIGTATAIKEVNIDNISDLTQLGAHYTIDSANITGDIISVFVKYSGGCKEHSFEMYSNGMYEKSLPPKISVILKHTNNSDACRELVMQELRFNITKLKNASTKTIFVLIGNQQIMYSYK